MQDKYKEIHTSAHLSETAENQRQREDAIDMQMEKDHDLQKNVKQIDH